MQMTFVIAWMFCGKSHVAHYGVEFDPVWGVSNPGVDGPPSMLGCLAASRV